MTEIGDCREIMRRWIGEGVKVQMCVTSPPYWRLRDYGVAGQLGLEPTPQQYVANMVEVFRLVRELLADDGTLWLNLGSSYASGDTNPSRSRPALRDPSCGSDDKGPQDSRVCDLSCRDLCDECLDDFWSHHGRTAGSTQPSGRSSRQLSQIDRDTAQTGSALASLDALPLAAPESNTLESWLQHRGACLRCDNRAFALSGAHSSSSGVPTFAHTTWLNYTRRLKHKDLIPTPWMVAMALQADGWWLRQDIIYSKANPMPESVRDRCTKSHEYIFLLSKSATYYFDADAIKEPASEGTHERRAKYPNGKTPVAGWATGPGSHHAIEHNKPKNGKRKLADAGYGIKNNASFDAAMLVMPGWRNKRSVWTVATQPFKGAHFATFPPDLIKPCILAGSRPGDIVLDPFMGSGTTARVAIELGRRSLGCELNPAYAPLQDARTRVTAGLPLA